MVFNSVSIFLLVLACICCGENTNICYKPGNLPAGLSDGKRLLDSTFATFQTNGLMNCGKACLQHKICQSVNFNTVTSTCELNVNSTGNIAVNNDYDFVEISHWPSRLLGVCENHNCLQHEMCVENDLNGFRCEPIGCSSFINNTNTNKTSFESKSVWSFNEVVEYPCIAGYLPTQNVTCHDNGRWGDFLCVAVSRCASILKCILNPESTEYWLTMFSGQQRMKVFCVFSKRGGVSAYLTLPEVNKSLMSGVVRISDGSCDAIEPSPLPHPDVGETHFQKVRIKTTQRVLDSDKFPFSNSSGKNVKYGLAGDCYGRNDTCGVTGRFYINLTGTGVRLNSSVQWITWGNNARIEYINKSDDGLVMEGLCGGNCGGCQPSENEIKVDPDPTYSAPPESEAVLLKCKSLL